VTLEHILLRVKISVSLLLVHTWLNPQVLLFYYASTACKWMLVWMNLWINLWLWIHLMPLFPNIE